MIEKYKRLHRLVVKFWQCNRTVYVLKNLNLNGDVSVCCNDFYNEINFGNVNNQSFMSIWNSKKYLKFRKDIKRGIFNYPVCKRCVGIKIN